MTTANLWRSDRSTTSIKIRADFNGTNGDTADGVSIGIYPYSYSSNPDEIKSDTFTETSSKDVYLTFYGLDPDTTYYFEGSFTLGGGLDGNYPTSRYNFSTEAESTRPSDFSWTYSKNSGNPFNLRAFEWNDFTDRVNAFREYDGLSAKSFNTAYSGNEFTAYMFNQAVIGIAEMNPPTSTPGLADQGDTVRAYDLNRLVDSLNSIS